MSHSEQRPQASFDDFVKIDMRVAKVLAAPIAEGTRAPTRELTLEVGELGTLKSVGQYALVEETELVGAKVVVVVNLGTRRVGRYLSEVLVLGVPHPKSPSGQAQALPLRAPEDARPGEKVY